MNTEIPPEPKLCDHFKEQPESIQAVVNLVRKAFKTCFHFAQRIFISQENYVENSRRITKAAEAQRKVDHGENALKFLFPGTQQEAKVTAEVDRLSKKKDSIETRKKLQSLQAQLKNKEAQITKMKTELSRRLKNLEAKEQKQATNSSKEGGGPAETGAQTKTNQSGQQKNGAQKRSAPSATTQSEQQGKSKKRRLRKQKAKSQAEGSGPQADAANQGTPNEGQQGQNPNSSSQFIKGKTSWKRKKSKSSR
jgi:hypothetical protein